MEGEGWREWPVRTCRGSFSRSCESKSNSGGLNSYLQLGLYTTTRSLDFEVLLLECRRYGDYQNGRYSASVITKTESAPLW